MNRRKALQQLALLCAGTAALPACFLWRDDIYGLSLNTISIDNMAAIHMEALAEVLLPSVDLDYERPEHIAKFIENMMNNCHAPEQVQQYADGYKTYKKYLKETFNMDIDGLSPNEEQQLFEAIQSEDRLEPNAAFFLRKTKELVQRHFTSCEQYMKNYNNYEYAPGRFNGCVSTNS